MPLLNYTTSTGDYALGEKYMKNSEVVFYDTQQARDIGESDLRSKGFLCKFFDLTEMPRGGYAIQYRDKAFKNTPWEKLDHY